MSTIGTDNPELLRAQLAALSRLIPLLYAMLVANAWVMAITFWGKAPNWLSIHVAVVLSLICFIRLLQWWRKRDAPISNEQAARELQRTNIIAIVLGLAFSTWAIALFPYGDAYAQAHVGTFLALAMLGCMLCLIHLRSAAICVALTVGLPFAVFFALTGVPTFVGTAINVSFVTIAVVIVILIQYRDFTNMVDAQKQTERLSNENLRLANLDSLTGLASRRAFFVHLEETFLAARSNGTRLAVGIIDLDGFKSINDLYGHVIGDKLLAEAASRILLCKSYDRLFLSRLGGDEFAYIVENAGEDAAILEQGEQIATLLRPAFVLSDVTVQISGSIGMAVYPEMASSSDELYERADYALYHAKDTKRGHVSLFSSYHEAQINRDARIEQALKRADFEQEFSVAFQPIVNVRTQTTVGFEALARWVSPELGWVSPKYFIPVAERSGLISSLTRPLLRKALAAAEEWPKNIRLSFNLSSYDLSSAETILSIVSLIEKSPFDAKRIDLEITETALGYDFAQVLKSIQMLRLLGCGISLDDCGVGYSNLSRLHALPLTKIKIDRSFVTDIDKNEISQKIVRSLLALSADMGLECVIEGVETAEEIAEIRKLGGLLVQGYFYSPPLPPAEALAYLHWPTKEPLSARKA